MHTLRKGQNEHFQGRQCKFHISTIKAPLFTLLIEHIRVENAFTIGDVD